MKQDGRAGAGQLDLFIALIDDIPLRDQRETMERPFFSLSKTPRTAPIDYQQDGVSIRVEPHQAHGMASIWDADILIWAASQITERINQGLKQGPMISFHAYDLLKAIRRDVGGINYRHLRDSLNRLAATLVTTNIRAENQKTKTAVFHWLEGWTEQTDADGNSLGMTITLPQWLYQGIVMRGGVLKIDPAYFDLTGGIERWLYRVARKHGGNQATGWNFTMEQLRHKSGTTRRLADFAKDVRRIVTRNDLPEYHLAVFRGERGDEVVSFTRRTLLAAGHPARDGDLLAAAPRRRTTPKAR